MRRRSRIRRVLKWVGLAGCAVIILGWGVSAIRLMGVAQPIGRSSLWLGVEKGRVVVFWHRWFWLPSRKGWNEDAHSSQWPQRLGMDAPDLIRSRGGAYGVRVPFWILFAMITIPTAFLWHRDRRPPKGHCQTCGYDLTGNVSGVCPECGEPA